MTEQTPILTENVPTEQQMLDEKFRQRLMTTLGAKDFELIKLSVEKEAVDNKLAEVQEQKDNIEKEYEKLRSEIIKTGNEQDDK